MQHIETPSFALYIGKPLCGRDFAPDTAGNYSAPQTPRWWEGACYPSQKTLAPLSQRGPLVLAGPLHDKILRTPRTDREGQTRHF